MADPAFDANCSVVRSFFGGTDMHTDSGYLNITVAANATVAVFVTSDTFSGDATLTVTEGSNTYTKVGFKKFDTANQNQVAIFLFEYTGGGGALSINVTSSGGTFGKCWATSFVNCGPYSATNDPPVQTTGNSTTPATGDTAALSAAKSVVLTAFFGNTQSWTAGTFPPNSGYTDLYHDGTNGIVYAYKLVTGSTPVNADIGTVATGLWGAVIVILPSQAAGAGKAPVVMLIP